jgi:hypothetical protein
MRPILIAFAVFALLSSCAENKDGWTSTPAAEPSPQAPDVFKEITPAPPSESTEDGEGNPPPEEDTVPAKSVEITDLSVCQGPTPEMTWLFSSSWSSKHKLANGVVLERVMSFSQVDVEVVVKAKYKNKFQQIKVSSALNWNDTEFNLLSLDQDQAVLPLENENFNLSFGLSPSTVKYSFAGPCLQIDLGNSEKLTFVPVIDAE